MKRAAITIASLIVFAALAAGCSSNWTDDEFAEWCDRTYDQFFQAPVWPAPPDSKVINPETWGEISIVTRELIREFERVAGSVPDEMKGIYDARIEQLSAKLRYTEQQPGSGKIDASYASDSEYRRATTKFWDAREALPTGPRWSLYRGGINSSHCWSTGA